MRLKKWLIGVLTVIMSLTTLFAIAACKEDEPIDEEQPFQEGPEVGVYYYDTGLEEYQIVLSGNNQFTFLVMGENKTGTYTLTDTTLVLDFARAEDGEVTATLSDDVLSLTWQDSAMRFLRQISYSVTFDAQEGSAVGSVSVINGKTISRPDDPVRDGYVFVGWYTDTAHTTPFMFDAQPVTSNLTLYAYWLQKTPGSNEYTVDFDLGYDAEAPAAMQTTAGCLVSLPAPEREGYTFLGWYVSASDSAEKLTYEYTVGTKLNENTTLYALWEEDGDELAAPAVSVTATGVTWNAVSGSAIYFVTITGPDQETLVDNARVQTTYYEFDFTAQEAGEYLVSVSASSNLAGTGTLATASRYYVNRALARVSVFDVVEPSALIFEGVPNAERYYLTIDCGNDAHTHDMVALGKMTSYNFANCPMQEGGIRFVVTAEADGYVSSVSKEFVYNRELAQVTGLVYEAETQTFYWDAVADAMGYVVAVNGTTAEIGNVMSYSVDAFAAGEIVFSIYPVTKGYNSPVASTMTVTKAEPATPANIHVNDANCIVWDAVAGATSYTLSINGTTYSETENSFDLAQIIGEGVLEGTTFTVSVRANSDAASSLWSKEQTLEYLVMGGQLKYSANVFSWNDVVGAEYYDVQVNDGDIVTVRDANSAVVRLTQAGNNILRVRFGNASYLSDWRELTVFAYEIAFDSRGGTAVPSVYVANGDAISYPEDPEREDYRFDGWYTVPGGAEANGAQYGDQIFAEGANLILYANWVWIPTPSTVTLNAHYGALTEDVVEVLYGMDYTLEVPANTQERDERYVFNGWFSEPNGNGIRYTDMNGQGVSAWPTKGDTTLYASWLEVFSFTQTVDAVGNTVYAVAKGPEIGRMSSITIPATYKGVLVARIYSGAFDECITLTEINVPDSIVTIGSVSTSDAMGAFSGCISLMNVNVYEAEGDHDVYYWSEDGVLIYDNPQTQLTRLVYYPEARRGAYRIPDGVEEIPIRTFAEMEIPSITVPASVQYIRSAAFFGCTNLREVIFESGEGASLTIDDLAFQNCTALTSISLPKHLTQITADEAFLGCNALVNIFVEEGNAAYSSVDGLLCDASGTKVIFCPMGKSGVYNIPTGILEIGEAAFEGRDKLTEVNINAYVTSIGVNAFADCANLYRVTFATDAAATFDITIADYAFYNCTKLDTVTFSENVVGIGASAFGYCETLRELNLPGSLNSIGANAFQSCTHLTSVVFNGGEGTLTVGDAAFSDCVLLSTVTLSASVTSFDAVNVLAGCDNLESIEVADANPNYADIDGVLYTKDISEILYYPKFGSAEAITLPDTVKTIGESAFAGNGTITSLTIGGNVTLIEANAFDRCISLVTVIFENDGTEPLVLGEYAFANCPLIASVVLPDRLQSISNYAFNLNGSLKDVDFGNSIQQIGEYAFAGTALEEIVIPDTVTSLGVGAFDSCASLVRVEFPASMTTIGGSIFSNCPKLSEVIIPEGVTSIGERAFEGAASLSEIALPSTLVTIGEYAFADCTSLTSIEIPASVATIGRYAFDGCSALASVTFEAGTQPLTIDDYAFQYCTSITSIEFPTRLQQLGTTSGYLFRYGSLEIVTFAEGESQLEAISDFAFATANLISIELPEGLKTIGRRAFYNSGSGAQMESIVIPSTVTLIEEGAFYCQSALQSITFASVGKPMEELESLTIEESVFTGVTVESITLPKNLASITAPMFFAAANGGANSYDWRVELREIVLEEGNENFVLEGNILYEKNISGETETWSIALVPTGYTGALTVSNRVTSIPEYAFMLSRAESITLPDTITSIGNYAFNFASFSSVTIPGSVTTIGRAAFGYESRPSASSGHSDYVSPLKEVIFAEGTAELKITGNNAFKNTSITSIELPERLTSISGMYAFEATALTSVTIPASLATIGNYAFRNCEALTQVTFAPGCSLKTIGTSLFQNSGLQSIEIPASVTTINNNAFRDCKELTSVTFEAGGTAELTIANGSTSTSSTVSTSAGVFRGCDALTTITLPARLTLLGAFAFADCTSLKEVLFEEGSRLETIGNLAFWNTALEEIVIPAGVTTLGTASATTTTGAKYGVFLDCENLTSVTLPDDYSFQWNRFIGCTALEEINVTANNVEYSSQDGVLMSKDGYSLVYFPIGKNVGETYTVPSTVTTIEANAFYSNTTMYAKISGIVIPESVTEIGNNAFRYVPLESVVLPDSLTTLGTYLFANNKVLTEITIPAGITAIPNFMFQNCSALTEVHFAPNSRLTSIGNSAFDNSGLASIEIPASVESIGSSTFSYAAFESITFAPNSALTSIGAGAFEDSSLTEVELPDSVVTMGNYVFRDSPLLERVKLPSGITTIPMYTFQDCDSLKEVEFGDNVVEIARDVFKNCISLESIEIPAGVETMGQSVFYGCTGLKEVTFEEGSRLTSITSVTTMNSGIFQNCTSLERVDLPDSLGNIPNYAFSGCESLISIEIPEQAVEIGKQAFENCTGLEYVRISGSVESIGTSAFSGCTALSDVNFMSGLTTIGESAFSGCTSLTTVVLPDSVISIGSNAFANIDGLDLSVEDGNTAYIMDEHGVLYDSRMSSIISFPADLEGVFVVPDTVTAIPEGIFRGTSVTEVTLPASVTEISDSMFENAKNLTKVTINGRITSIGKRAFAGSGIRSITIGRYVTSIGESAFDGCANLKEVIFEANGSSALQIGDYAFRNCTSLENIELARRIRNMVVSTDSEDKITLGIGVSAFEGCTALKTVTFEQSGGWLLTEGLSIGASAFKNSGLESIVIPSTSGWVYNNVSTYGSHVPNLGESCFEGCVNLKDVTFEPIDNSYFYVGANLFKNCTSLEYIELPDEFCFLYKVGGNSRYASGLFAGCTSLKEAVITVSDLYATTTDVYAFDGCTALETVTIKVPAGLIYNCVNRNMFRDCTALKTVNIGHGVFGIGEQAFAGCSSLTTVSIPSSVESIGDRAFDGCSALTAIELPRLLEEIGEEAFAGCSSLASFTVAANNADFMSLDGNLYSKDGTQLIRYAAGKTETSFAIPAGVTSIAAGAFDSCGALQSVTIPASVTTIGAGAFANYKALTAINVDAANPNFSSIDGNLYSKDGTTLIQYATGKAETSYAVANSVTAIGAGAFKGAVNLTSVTLPETVTSIGAYAFDGCSGLTSVTIPASVTSIGAGAFANCSNLTAINVAEGSTHFKSVDGNLYSFDGSVLVQYAVGKTDTTFTVPEGVTTIASGAFEGAKLTSVTIPGDVKTVQAGAFEGWTSAQSLLVTFKMYGEPDGFASTWAERATIVYAE